MMEKFVEQYNDWTQSHHDTWIARRTPGPDWLGAGVSAQLDLMSSTSLYDFAMNPTQMNLAKVAYSPIVAGAGYSWVSAITGHQIQFAHRVAHTAEMGLHTSKAMGSQAVRQARLLRWLPFGIGLAMGVDVGVRGHESAFASALGSFWNTIDPWGLSEFQMR